MHEVRAGVERTWHDERVQARGRGPRRRVVLTRRQDEVLPRAGVFAVKTAKQAATPKIGQRGRGLSISEEQRAKGRTQVRAAPRKARGGEGVGQGEVMQVLPPQAKGRSQSSLEAVVSVTNLTLRETCKPISTNYSAKGRGPAKSCLEGVATKHAGLASKVRIGHRVRSSRPDAIAHSAVA